MILWAVAIQWTMSQPCADIATSHAAAPASGRKLRVGEPWAYLQYEVEQTSAMDDVLELPMDFDWTGPLVVNRLRDMCSARSFSGSHDLDTAIDALGLLVTSVFYLSAAEADVVRDGVCNALVRSLALGNRLPINYIPSAYPSLNMIRRLRGKWRTGRGAMTLGDTEGPETYEAYMERYNNVVLQLPKNASTQR